MDGRTTIFDYWSVPSLRRWHLGKSKAHERRLRSLYREVLRLASDDKTLAFGHFFDLMYVNQDTLDTHRHYAYLRHCDGEMTLVVTNFGPTMADVVVRIPQQALDCAQMPHGDYDCTDLMTGQQGRIALTDDSSVQVHIDAHGAVLLKISRIQCTTD